MFELILFKPAVTTEWEHFEAHIISRNLLLGCIMSLSHPSCCGRFSKSVNKGYFNVSIKSNKGNSSWIYVENKFTKYDVKSIKVKTIYNCSTLID